MQYPWSLLGLAYSMSIGVLLLMLSKGMTHHHFVTPSLHHLLGVVPPSIYIVATAVSIRSLSWPCFTRIGSRQDYFSTVPPSGHNGSRRFAQAVICPLDESSSIDTRTDTTPASYPSIYLSRSENGFSCKSRSDKRQCGRRLSGQGSRQ